MTIDLMGQTTIFRQRSSTGRGSGLAGAGKLAVTDGCFLVETVVCPLFYEEDKFELKNQNNICIFYFFYG